jgi:IS605 OrfB family transposase
MIRSTTSSIKFSNKEKQNQLHLMVDEYRSVMKQIIDLIWEENDIPKLLPKEITSQVNTWLSARMIQCAAKQASSVVRGTKQKQRQRKFMIDQLKSEGDHHRALKLQKIYDKTKTTKPNINHVCPELDSRFVKIDLENETSFDGWITFSSIGNKMKIQIPFKKSKHFNRLLKKGEIKSGIRLSKKQMTFMFDLPEVETKTSGVTLGIDIGLNKAVSCSNGFQSSQCNHGHDLKSITEKLSRKKKGSKNFKKAQEHRKNYINWTINQLNLDSVKELKLEKIQHLRKRKKTNRMLSHWTYTALYDKLESKCEEQGVLVRHVSPSYTSQQCSECGWTDSSNRNGDKFKCTNCAFEHDADLNASINISRKETLNERHL